MNRQKKALLSRISVLLVMILIVGVSFDQLALMSVTQDAYAPGAIIPMEGRESIEYVIVYGRVFYFNETLGYDLPVVNIRVRLWATDELFEDIIWADNDGKYESIAVFRVGQLITLMIEGIRYIRFISYHAAGKCELDPIYLWE